MELQDLLKELQSHAGTAPFSRIRYLTRHASEEEVSRFFVELLVKTIQARENNSWEEVTSYLEKWEALLMQRYAQRLAYPETGSIPWASLAKPVKHCRFALVTTGGIHLEDQEPFAPSDDLSYRLIPKGTPQERLRVSHRGYDTAGPRQDVDCVFPLHRFQELEKDRTIGELAGLHYSFMGLIHDPASLAQSGAEVAQKLRDAGIDAAFLTST